MSLDCLHYTGVIQASPKKEKREEVEHPITGALSGRSFELLPDVFYDLSVDDKLNFLESNVHSFDKRFFKSSGNIISLDESIFESGDQYLRDSEILSDEIAKANYSYATIKAIKKWTQRAAIISGFAASVIALIGATGALAVQSSLILLLGGVGVGLGILGFAAKWYKNIQKEHVAYLVHYKGFLAEQNYSEKLEEQVQCLEAFFDYTVNKKTTQKPPAVSLQESSSIIGFSVSN